MFCLAQEVCIAGAAQQFDIDSFFTVGILRDLSTDNQCNLHFLLGPNIARRIREDPSINGTLNLFETLFDQQKISCQDFTYLIKAFESIKCLEAADRLKEHQQAEQSRRRALSTNSTNTAALPTITELIADNCVTDKYRSSRTLNLTCGTNRHQKPSGRAKIANQQNNIYSIQSVYNQKAIDLTDGSSSNTIKFQQWDRFNENNNQHFKLIHSGEGHYCLIESLPSGKALDSKLMKNAVSQSEISPKNLNNQLWQFIEVINTTLYENIWGNSNSNGKFISSVDLSDSFSLFTASLAYACLKVVGGDGGEPFDDSKTPGFTYYHYCSSVHIWWTDWINSTQFTYSSSTQIIEADRRGNVGDMYHIFNVSERNKDERINRIDIYSGERYISNGHKPNTPTKIIVGIQFYTTHNNSSPFYGSKRTDDAHDILTYDGYILGYVRGKSCK
ncbi:unnamed protein product, partial [Didymodactylos carnosus]